MYFFPKFGQITTDEEQLVLLFCMMTTYSEQKRTNRQPTLKTLFLWRPNKCDLKQQSNCIPGGFDELFIPKGELCRAMKVTDEDLAPAIWGSVKVAWGKEKVWTMWLKGHNSYNMYLALSHFFLEWHVTSSVSSKQMSNQSTKSFPYSNTERQCPEICMQKFHTVGTTWLSVDIKWHHHIMLLTSHDTLLTPNDITRHSIDIKWHHRRLCKHQMPSHDFNITGLQSVNNKWHHITSICWHHMTSHNLKESYTNWRATVRFDQPKTLRNITNCDLRWPQVTYDLHW